MREAAGSALQNINTFQSKDVVKEYLDKLQTNEDGTTRPAGAVGLDLSSPASIQKIMNMEQGTMAKLLELSGGQMGTPEMQGIQNISDRILRGMNLGSEMAARAGTTEYQKGQVEIGREKNRLEALGIPSEIALRLSQVRLNDRLPKDTADLYGSMSKSQLDELENVISAFTASKNVDVSKNIGPIVDAIRNNPLSSFEGVLGVIRKENPKLTAAQAREKTKNIFAEIMPSYQSKQKEKLDQQRREKLVTTVQSIRDKWFGDANMMARQQAEAALKRAFKDNGQDVNDATISKMAWGIYRKEALKELAQFDADYALEYQESGGGNDALGVRGLFRTERPAPTSTNQPVPQFGQAPDWLKNWQPGQRKK